MGSPFLNSHKDLDLSYKMDLDFWGYFGRGNLPLISQENRNMENGEIKHPEQLQINSCLELYINII